MVDVVSIWQQPHYSHKREQMSKAGKECTGARRGGDRGTNTTLQKLYSRIRTERAVADIVGSTGCCREGQLPPTDEEIDRGVRHFLPYVVQCLTQVATTRDALDGGGPRHCGGAQCWG